MWPVSRRMPLIALALAATLLVVGVALAIYSERSYREQKSREVGAQAKILASTVAAALLFDDGRATQEYVNALAENPDILAAAVYDAEGAFVGGYLRSSVLGIPPAVLRGPPRFDGNHLIVTIPVLADGDDVGSVYLRALTEPVERRWMRYGAVGLLIFLVSLVVVVLSLAHAALSRANAELERRAANLAELNADLETQIVERQRAEEALRHSQKLEAIGQLSGGIAHDFNNLLAVIQGSLQLLQLRIGQGRYDVGKYVEMAMEGLSRATSLTQRILAFSRRHPLSPKPVDLSRLALGMNVLLGNSVGDNIAIEWRMGADWWTFCDTHQMENVILNLAINARDAMPEGGRLTVETANLRATAAAAGDPPPGDYVLLAIADTGTGMTEEVREKAFDPFFTTKPAGKGTGLGLSMVFGFVKQSNGYLRIESAVGEGTRIVILMPRHEGADIPAVAAMAEAGDAAAPAMTAAPDGAGRRRILLVEDEASVRRIVAEALQDDGFEVLQAEDGAEAIRRLGTTLAVDMLLSDVNLPGANGFQVAEAALAADPSTKVLLMTGFTRNTLPRPLAEAGVEIIYKPYDLQELRERIARILAASVG